MSRAKKTLADVLSGHGDQNIRFDALRSLLSSVGFDERINGDHHVFTRDDVREIINIQPRRDGTAKPYQVKQVRGIITSYRPDAAMKYEVIIYWSDDDAAFIAEVPELAGCMADGPTKAEALANVERIAAEWVENGPRPGPRRARTARPADVRLTSCHH